MLPVYLGKVMVNDTNSYIFTCSGNCFESIQISTNFTYDCVGGGITADVTINLDQPSSSLCTEHFLIGTPFEDIYDFYYSTGKKKLSLDFTETHHKIDLLTNGLRIFTICSEHTSVFSSVFQTTNLFAGGLGSSKFIPFVGSKVPSYMMSSNVEFLQKFTKKTL